LFIKKYPVSFVECKHTPGRPYNQTKPKTKPHICHFCLAVEDKNF
jgi:hypothetical protein